MEQPYSYTYRKPSFNDPPVKKSREITVVVLVAVAAFLLTGVLTGVASYFLFFAPKYTDPIDLYVEAIYDGKVNTVERQAPDEYWDRMAAKTGLSRDAYIQLAQQQAKELNATMEDQFGEDFECAYRVTGKKEMTAHELGVRAQWLLKDYGISTDTVKKGYTVTIDMKLAGKDHKGVQLEVVQIGRNWYWVDTQTNTFGYGYINIYFHIDGIPATIG